MTVDLIGPVLASYVVAALEVLDPKPTRVIKVAPGDQVAWDDCCDGQLWGRVIRVQPFVGANRSGARVPCGVLYWNVTVALGIIRCAHGLNDDGTAPAAHLISGDGQEMLDDLAALQEVVLCHPRTSAVNLWTPLGPQGGCHGGEWEFVIRVDVCPCDQPVVTPHG